MPSRLRKNPAAVQTAASAKTAVIANLILGASILEIAMARARDKITPASVTAFHSDELARLTMSAPAAEDSRTVRI